MLITDVRCRNDAKTKVEAVEVIEAMGLIFQMQSAFF